jgi:putative PIN family toxin of toxin-antitoxin system
MKRLKAVLDTNVLVTALLSENGASRLVLHAIAQNLFDLAITVPLVLEYESSAMRVCEERGIDTSVIEPILNFWCAIGIKHQVHFLWRPGSKDPGDDMVIESAVAAQADCIVSYNAKDLKTATQFGIDVISPHTFLQRIGVLP